MSEENISRNFIENIIDKDLEEGKYTKIVTRFPPEPNGYLHIGHAKSILLNYGLACEYNGQFNLRFDDTNPTKEKEEFVDSIIEDVKWLGADFRGEVLYASNYFDQMYEAAIKLINKGKAYVDDLSAEEIREYRGTLTEPGKNSPFRDRSIEENLQLFEDMKAGKFEDGSKVLRAKIDMASPNINMRDPVIYRIARMTHHNTGDKWCIYPMYDFAHPIEDAIEGVTHSICTLEFEDHRPLYDWVVDNTEWENPPRQIEFAKLYLTNVVTGKRYIKKLVEQLSNQDERVYLGIHGASVTGEVHSLQKIPYGVYVTEVDAGSPAFDGGINNGDVVEAINGTEIKSVSDYMNCLNNLTSDDFVTLQIARYDGKKYTTMETEIRPKLK